MRAGWLVLTLLLVFSRSSQVGEPPKFVPAWDINYSLRDGVLELRGGRGWLRTERLFLNFTLTFEFKAATPDADPGVFVRAWVSPQRGGNWTIWGYRIDLPHSSSRQMASVTGHGRQVKTLQDGKVPVLGQDDWQRVEVSGEGSRLRVMLNGTLLGVFELEDFGGYVLFNNAKGRAEFRNIDLSTTEREPEIPADVMTVEQLRKAGGSMPKVLREAKPNYTMDAMREKVQGIVPLQVVVLADGSAGLVRVQRSLHRDLDLAAIAAARAWRFAPATVNGEKVPVLVDIEMSFALR